MVKTMQRCEDEENLFVLYDIPGSSRASDEIKRVVDQAARDLADVLHKHTKFGGTDTATCEAVDEYLWETMKMEIGELIMGDIK